MARDRSFPTRETVRGQSGTRSRTDVEVIANSSGCSARPSDRVGKPGLVAQVTNVPPLVAPSIIRAKQEPPLVTKVLSVSPFRRLAETQTE